MKNLISLVLAGIVGGAIAFGAFKLTDRDTIIYQEQPAKVYPVSNTSVHTRPSSAPASFVEAANKANPAVVHISAQNKEYVQYDKQRRQRRSMPYGDFWGFGRGNESPKAGAGSGVIISSDGYIVTNNHVVGFADYIEVTTADNKKFKAQKIGTDPSTDLAVIKIIDEGGRSFNYLSFGNSDNVRVGEWVVAVGNPFNLTSTVTAGIVSAMARDLDIIQELKTIEEFIQTDAVVNPGNSGGALVDTKGRLIGINTAISSPTGVYAGYSFAIPSNLVKRVVDEIMEYGDIERAFLGISTADLNQARIDGYKVEVSKGVFVADFMHDQYRRKIFSSAEVAGVEIGDIIIGINGSDVDNYDDLSKALKFSKVGDTVDVTIFRNGKKKTIPVKLRQGI